MKKVHNSSALFAFLLSLAAAPAFAFEAVDTIPWPSRGEFPAYPQDETRPTSLWGQAGVRTDNNMLRRESPTSETIFRIGAGVRHEQRVIGRQRVLLEARGDLYTYERFSELDHFAYALLGDWRWELGNNLDGSILIGRDRRQADLAETQSERRDLVTSNRLGATARYALTPRVRVRGGLATTRTDREAFAAAETRGYTASGAVEYVSPLDNTIGVEYRRTRGDAPVPDFVAPLGTFVNNDYQEREIALVVTWVPSALWRTGGRIGHTTREYTELAGRDFDGTTYRAFVDWLPSNKTILGFEAYKVPESVIDVSAGHVLVKGVAFGPRWAITNKTVLSARLFRDRRTFEGDPVVGAGGPLRDEEVIGARLALGWEPQRFWQIGFAVDRGERESNVAGRDYQYTAFMANVAVRW